MMKHTRTIPPPAGTPRRSRLWIAFAAALTLLALPSCPAPPTLQPAEHSDVLVIAAGDATQDSIILWVKPPAAGLITLRWRRHATTDSETITLNVGNPLVPVKHELSGLQAGVTYEYEVETATGESRSGRFRTPAARGTRAALRFGVTGDWRGDLAPYPAIRNAPNAGLDFLVLLGDTMYADVASPALRRTARTLDEFRLKHAETLAERLGVASWAELRAATAMYAMIDDHELFNDFAGAATPPPALQALDAPVEFMNQTARYQAAMQAFDEFHPIRSETYSDTGDSRFDGRPRLYRQRRFGDTAALFIVDARSFRDAPLDTPPIPPEPFFRDAFTAGRTMLGRTQLAELKQDLLNAQRDGMVWKFVCIPQPIQNLGPILAADRYEGYAAERSELLGFIRDNEIRNVVFITADIHCTIVNNLTYQQFAGGPQIPVDAWEISTGAVAYAPPFGPTTAGIGSLVPIIGPPFAIAYFTSGRVGRDLLLTGVLNDLLGLAGYEPVGLDPDRIPSTLISGQWVSLHTFGWTQFDIDAETWTLRVTTWGIPDYDEIMLLTDPEGILSRTPEAVSVFEVTADMR